MVDEAGRRPGGAERVADALRGRLAEGRLAPGARLSEEAVSGALGVSRNTLREAFRLLTHEGLLVHRPHRGVFVRQVTAADLADIFRLRTLIECGALRGLGAPPYPLAPVSAAVAEGAWAAEQRSWRALLAADIRFHRELVALAGSPRADEVMRRLLAELGLAFQVMDDPRGFHLPFLDRNRLILAALRRADPAGAERLLADYLADSRDRLAAAYAARDTAS